MNKNIVDKILNEINENKILKLASEMIKIPSPRFGEAKLAEFIANYLEQTGFKVDFQDVIVSDKLKSKQAIGKLEGVGGSKSLILCGHLDTTPVYRSELWTKKPLEPVVEDGWLYGWGAGNMKCGVAAMISAVEAIKKSDIKLSGDLIVACVMGETAGGVGVQHMLDKGIKADMAIVPERTGLDICTVGIGQVRGKIEVEGRLRYRADGGEIHPIEKMIKVLKALGKSYQPIPQGSYLTFKPHPKLPGYPQIVITNISSEGDFCNIIFNLKIVPGQSEESVRKDLQRLLDELCAQDPKLKVKLIVPPSPDIVNRKLPDELPHDSPVVKYLSKWHKYITGKTPIIGAGKRLGSPADASNLNLAGIDAVTYGPGVSDPWPTPDERNNIEETIIATKVIALAVADVYGVSI